MGGTSTSSQATQQQQTQSQSGSGSTSSNPWANSLPTLNGILGQLNPQIANTGLTGTENTALNTTQANANNYSSQYAPQIGAHATNLLNGGGATNQAGAVNQNYQDYYRATNPLASNTNYNPYDTPGFRDAINTATSDITNNTNGTFAAAGRDFSGANSMALGRGLTQGLAPTIAAQYNQNVQNQQGAAGNLYNAGNTNAGILSGMQQQSLTNQGQGVTASGQALDASNAGANVALQAEAARRGIPVQALGLLAQIGIPIAGLGGTSNSQTSGTGTSTGNSNTQGSQTMSGAQQFGTIAQGIGSIGSIFRPTSSDRRLKEDIEQVGTLFDGTPVYGYRYIGSPNYQIGLMAQDVEKTVPAAVVEINGFKAVYYELATEASRKMKAA